MNINMKKINLLIAALAFVGLTSCDYDGSDWIGTYYMLGNALVLDTSVVFVFNEYGDIVDQDGNDMYASELPDEYL